MVRIIRIWRLRLWILSARLQLY